MKPTYLITAEEYCLFFIGNIYCKNIFSSALSNRKQWSTSLLLKSLLCDLTSAPKIKGHKVRSAWLADIKSYHTKF